MRKVLIYSGLPTEKCGLFHGFFGGPDESAVIELEDGSVITVAPYQVTFMSPPENENSALRDQFAGQVISATLAAEGRRFYQNQDPVWAYEIADAMLKAREGVKK